MNDQTSNRTDLIESRVNRSLADEISISREAGGVDIRKLGEVMEAAKLMAISGPMVPAFMRDQPGVCFGIIWKAYHWGMDPFAVASMAYEVENPKTKERTVAFMSQLIHAVIEARAPIKGRLAVAYEGEGEDRVCIVSCVLRDGTGTREHRSPRLGDRRPRKQERVNQQTGEKYFTSSGSPLWYTKPDVQLFYDTSRDLARMHFPDVLLGVYDRDEMQEAGFEQTRNLPAVVAQEVENSLSSRLQPSGMIRAGFDIGNVVALTNDATMTATEAPGPVAEAAASPTPLPSDAAATTKRTRRPKEAPPEAKSDEPATSEPQKAEAVPDALGEPAAKTVEVVVENGRIESVVRSRAPQLLLDVRKAGGRAYFNGQPRSDGAKKYPDAGDADLLAEWLSGYDERREKDKAK